MREWWSGCSLLICLVIFSTLFPHATLPDVKNIIGKTEEGGVVPSPTNPSLNMGLDRTDCQWSPLLSYMSWIRMQCWKAEWNLRIWLWTVYLCVCVFLWMVGWRERTWKHKMYFTVETKCLPNDGTKHIFPAYHKPSQVGQLFGLVALSTSTQSPAAASLSLLPSAHLASPARHLHSMMCWWLAKRWGGGSEIFMCNIWQFPLCKLPHCGQFRLKTFHQTDGNSPDSLTDCSPWAVSIQL